MIICLFVSAGCVLPEIYSLRNKSSAHFIFASISTKQKYLEKKYFSFSLKPNLLIGSNNPSPTLATNICEPLLLWTLVYYFWWYVLVLSLVFCVVSRDHWSGSVCTFHRGISSLAKQLFLSQISFWQMNLTYSCSSSSYLLRHQLFTPYCATLGTAVTQDHFYDINATQAHEKTMQCQKSFKHQFRTPASHALIITTRLDDKLWGKYIVDVLPKSLQIDVSAETWGQMAELISSISPLSFPPSSTTSGNSQS